MITLTRETAIESGLDLTASQRTFPAIRKITTKGIPETLAEIYGGHSSGRDSELELFMSRLLMHECNLEHPKHERLVKPRLSSRGGASCF
jgi:hypothetical protein